MTKLPFSIRMRRIIYSFYQREYYPELEVFPPILLEDDYGTPGVDTLDTALKYDGQRHILGYAWDGSRQMQQDYTAPVVTITFYPNPSEDNQKTVAFVFDADEDFCTFFGKVEGTSRPSTAFVEVDSPLYYSGITTGTHTFSVYATDIHGNVGAVSTSSWFTTGTLI
jgi:hypothetical protein